MPIRRVWVYLCGVVGNTLLYVGYVYIIIVVCMAYPYRMRNVRVYNPHITYIHRIYNVVVPKMGCFHSVFIVCGNRGNIYLYFRGLGVSSKVYTRQPASRTQHRYVIIRWYTYLSSVVIRM